jgi:hypothetical protein
LNINVNCEAHYQVNDNLRVVEHPSMQLQGIHIHQIMQGIQGLQGRQSPGVVVVPSVTVVVVVSGVVVFGVVVVVVSGVVVFGVVVSTVVAVQNKFKNKTKFTKANNYYLGTVVGIDNHMGLY